MKSKFAGKNFLAVLIAIVIMTPFVISNLKHLKNTEDSVVFVNTVENSKEYYETEKPVTDVPETGNTSASAEKILNNIIISEYKKIVESEQDIICYYITPHVEKTNSYPQLIIVSKNSDYGDALSQLYSKVTVYEWVQNRQIVSENASSNLIEPMFYYNDEERTLFVAYGSEGNPTERIVARMQYHSFYEEQDLDENGDSLMALTSYADLNLIDQAFNEAITNDFK